LLQRICEAEEEVQAKEDVWEARKEDAKEAKDAFDAAVNRLRKLIRSANEDDTPLFRRNGHANGTPAPASDQAKPDESWKDVPLAEALEGIKPAVLEKLKGAELETVGQLQAFTEKSGLYGNSDPLTTIKGIGPETATKIADALGAFWERRKAEALATVDSVAEQIAKEACAAPNPEDEGVDEDSEDEADE
jgi:hypothetical protein